MGKRILKQIFVFSFYFSILVIIIFGAWYLFIREKKIDICGDGTCGPTESFSSCPADCPALTIWENLEVIDKIIVPARANIYDSAILIKNPNGAGGIKDLGYRIEFLGVGGNTIAFREGKTFVLPGDTKYVFELGIESPEEIKDLRVSFKDVEWQKLKSEIYREPDIIVKNKVFTFDAEKNEYRLIGRVENTSPFDFKEVFVQAFLQDEGGKTIGLNSTVQGALLSSEEREFDFSWTNDEIKGEVKNQVVKAEVNVFDSDTFMKRYGEAQPLY